MRRAILAAACCLAAPAAHAADAIPEGATVLRQGTLQGASGHRTEGTVSVIERADGGHALVLHPDFAHDGAPDPVLGFGKGGYRDDSQFAPLRRNTGHQVYDLPAELDPGAYRTFWVWCEKFSVGLGRAVLKP